jgi:hypothetical protein
MHLFERRMRSPSGITSRATCIKAQIIQILNIFLDPADLCTDIIVGAHPAASPRFASALPEIAQRVVFAARFFSKLACSRPPSYPRRSQTGAQEPHHYFGQRPVVLTGPTSSKKLCEFRQQ